MQLAATLPQLSLAHGYVGVWLVYRGLKPLSTVELGFDWLQDSPEKEKIQNWLTAAKLVAQVSRHANTTLHIASNQDNLDLNAQFELLTTAQAHQVRGRLYGFPIGAVNRYAQVMDGYRLSPPYPGLTYACFVPEVKASYWYPYVEYMLRDDQAMEDALTAKTWADAARADIPEVAKAYEASTIAAFERLLQR